MGVGGGGQSLSPPHFEGCVFNLSVYAAAHNMRLTGMLNKPSNNQFTGSFESRIESFGMTDAWTKDYI